MAAAIGPSGQVGVGAVSERLYEGASRYHAQIGPEVSRVTLRKLQNTLLEQAQQCCYEKKWEEALNNFMQCLALSDKIGYVGDGFRGILIHNIGFCLHCLGEFEAAKAYYEQSIECLEREEREKPLMKRVLNVALAPEQLALNIFFGSVTDNRIRMTKERLVDVTFGRTPDLKMLDGWGRKKPLPDKSDGREAATALSSEWASVNDDREWKKISSEEPESRPAPRWLAVPREDEEEAGPRSPRAHSPRPAESEML